ncbi:hypothetical protein SLS62_007803 [Diatrype stigma]|uniref:Alcohol dehydrogenase-like C-terminal domain-containing protein n=1 Tax=Diatrype stigma TaxID=117547 RepID=A0AAN9UNP1_9PEZI
MTVIPKTQTAATVPKLGGGVKFVHDYPVPEPGYNEVLAKVLYTGVCQSGKPAVKNANVKIGDWLVVVGAGGGLGHFAVQYAAAQGAQVIGVDGGAAKGDFVKSIGASKYIDFQTTPDLVQEVKNITNGGAHAVVVTAANPKAFSLAADMLRVGGTLSCVGIPSEKGYIQTPVSSIAIKGLHITGNLIGSLKECLEAVDLVRRGLVKPRITVRDFADLPAVYDELEKGEVSGRIVLKVAKEDI